MSGLEVARPTDYDAEMQNANAMDVYPTTRSGDTGAPDKSAYGEAPSDACKTEALAAALMRFAGMGKRQARETAEALTESTRKMKAKAQEQYDLRASAGMSGASDVPGAL